MLPILYKKTSHGAIEQWQISVIDETGFDAGTIVTTYGQLNSDKLQTTADIVSEGKNAGKKNETTALQQAEKEAKSKWTKQKKKGYVESLEDAQSGAVDAIVEGGIVPMLAHSYEKHPHKIQFPCFGQPKLDGIRCTAIIENGKCTLWTRTRKQITGVPHIIVQLEETYANTPHLVLDGELYNHALKNEFEKIVSFVRQTTPKHGHEIVEYHVYDVAKDGISFKTRFMNRVEPSVQIPVQYVWTTIIKNADDVKSYHDAMVAEGYEGVMLRNMDSMYKHGRSYDLQKVKMFQDAEFEIIGVEEGRGKLAGRIGAFVCKMEDGQTFKAKMSGTMESLVQYLEDPSTWQGKKLTVKYQELTGKNGVPRFPVGVVVRDYE